VAPDLGEMTSSQLGRRLPVAALIACLLGAGACAPQTIYSWGSYEQLVYDMYAKPGKADPGTQIAKLTADVERANAEGKKVPPGIHAHLGYLYYTQGQVAEAAEQLTIEKQLFPESGVFVDGMLARMKR
jgi:hypothetical protein